MTEKYPRMTDYYSSLISIEKLFQAWEEFKKGKRAKRDVQILERHLEDNIFDLYKRLRAKTYKHGTYSEFYVNDPKRRHIHKACVQDRIVHHLLYKYLYELFDRSFIHDSYSCRKEKGTHKAVTRLERFTKIVSRNYSRDCWALKLDIKSFFASIDHKILKKLISQKVKDEDILWLVNQVIDSFQSDRGNGKGIPLGNLTSQIFANIYLNELDQFVKHSLKIEYYLRYADDFIILNSDLSALLRCFKTVKQFLTDNLALQIHPQKIHIRKLTWGIDFCGYVVLPHCRLTRAKTKKRIIRKIVNGKVSHQGFQSHLGYFKHANSYKISLQIKNLFFLNS